MRKRVLCGFLAVMTLVVGALPMGAKAEEKVWDVTPSQTDYYVEFDNSSAVYLCNDGTVGSKVGTEYYLTYTVESMKIETPSSCGVMGTNQPRVRYPYVTSSDGVGGGLLNYSAMDVLMVEGNTYFFKFTITEDGYEYRAGWAKDEEAQYLKFGMQSGEIKTDSEHFGVWFGNMGMTGKLTRVRFYDKKGNDLGLQATAGRNVTVGREDKFSKDTSVNHKYTIELKDVYNVALSNRKMAIGDKVYMEYKVKSTDSKLIQWGGILSNQPKASYPYLTGYMKNQNLEEADMHNGPLLVEGAEYLIVFEKKHDRLDVIVQRTYKGQTISFSPGSTYGTFDKNAKFYSLWFGNTKEQRLNAVLEDYKCYDSNKNNLGVQGNLSSGINITHYGEIEDYAGCEALYACEEDGSMYALYEGKTLSYTEDGVTKKGTYQIMDGVMTATVEGNNTSYDYSYQYFTSDTGKVYTRVHACKVIFETGKGTKVDTQILNEENGYQVMRPNDPTLEGNKFEGWYTRDGKEFNFDKVVTKSVTLYAKWSDTEWLEQVDKLDTAPYIFTGLGILILAVAGVCGGIIIKKGDVRNGKRQKEN